MLNGSFCVSAKESLHGESSETEADEAGAWADKNTGHAWDGIGAKRVMMMVGPGRPTWNLIAWTFGRPFSSRSQWSSGSMWVSSRA